MMADGSTDSSEYEGWGKARLERIDCGRDRLVSGRGAVRLKKSSVFGVEFRQRVLTAAGVPLIEDPDEMCLHQPVKIDWHGLPRARGGASSVRHV
jgi:hypothetical protein